MYHEIAADKVDRHTTLYQELKKKHRVVIRREIRRAYSS